MIVCCSFGDGKVMFKKSFAQVIKFSIKSINFSMVFMQGGRGRGGGAWGQKMHRRWKKRMLFFTLLYNMYTLYILKPLQSDFWATLSEHSLFRTIGKAPSSMELWKIISWFQNPIIWVPNCVTENSDFYNTFRKFSGFLNDESR